MKYEVKQINICYSGPGWQSKSLMYKAWAVVNPFGVAIKTFETEEEATEEMLLRNIRNAEPRAAFTAQI